jgi:integrase
VISIPLSTPIFEGYANHLEQNRRAATTIYRNRRILSRLEQWASDRSFDAEHVTPVQMNQYINSTLREAQNGHPALSSVSCHGHLVCIRAAFQWALDVDLADGKNPCRRVKVDVRRTPQRFFTNAELRSILAACVTEREYLATTILILSGLRIHELAALRWERATGSDRRGDAIQLPWADLTDQVLNVLGKGEQPRRVPIHAILMPLLANARRHTESPYVLGNLSGGPLWTSGILHIINRPMRRVGLKANGVGGHAYRRAFNDTLRRNARGYDLERRIIVGHSIEGDINASRYSTVTISELADVVKYAYADDPILPSIAPKGRPCKAGDRAHPKNQ